MSQRHTLACWGFSFPNWLSLVEEFGQPAYRARQLFEALYRQRVETPEQISTLPQDFRQSLSEKGISVGLPAYREEVCFERRDGALSGGLWRWTKRGNRLDA